MLDIRQLVYDKVAFVAQTQHKSLPPLTDSMSILESGLDSLCVAIVLSALDDELDVVNPFSGDDASIPVTYADLIEAYSRAAKQH